MAVGKNSEEKHEAQLIHDLLNFKGIGESAVVGIKPVIQAIIDNRVAMLLALDGLHLQANFCFTCGLFEINPEKNCWSCGEKPILNDSAVDLSVNLALSHGGAEEIII